MFTSNETQSNSLGKHTEVVNPYEVLKLKQLEALKSLTKLLVREIETLEQDQARTDSGLPNGKVNLYDEVQRFEIGMIRNALILTGGVQTKAARLLGVKCTTLNLKVKRYKIEVMNSESVS